MAYIEHDQLDAQLKKLENVCAENGFTYKFLRDKYPVRIIISPDTSMDGQISMLDNPVGRWRPYRGFRERRRSCYKRQSPYEFSEDLQKNKRTLDEGSVYQFVGNKKVSE